MESEESSAATDISALPTEILLNIFYKLSAVDFVRARGVCKSWQDIIDDASTRDKQTWRHWTLQDFDQDMYRDTLLCTATMSWFEIYKSLHRWPRFVKGSDRKQLLIKCNHHNQVPQSRSDKIAVMTEHSIHFFSPDYQFLHKIDGRYLKYCENEHYRALLCNYFKLYLYKNGCSDVFLTLLDIRCVCLLGDSVLVKTDSGISCYKNGEKTFTVEGDFDGELNCDEHYVYLRTKEDEFFKMNKEGEMSKICTPFSRREFAGLLATYQWSAESRKFLEYCYRKNLNFVKNFKFHIKEWSRYGKNEGYMTSCAVYNDLLFIGTYQHDIYIINFERFKVVKKLVMGEKFFIWGIRSIIVTETASAIKIRAHTGEDITVFTLDK